MGKGGGEFTLLVGLKLCISFPVQSGSIPVRFICFVEKSWGIVCLLEVLNIIFMIFEGCLDSNPECCRSKLARYRLSHPSLQIINGRHKQRSGRHTLARQKNIQKKKKKKILYFKKYLDFSCKNVHIKKTLFEVGFRWFFWGFFEWFFWWFFYCQPWFTADSESFWHYFFVCWQSIFNKAFVVVFEWSKSFFNP